MAFFSDGHISSAQSEGLHPFIKGSLPGSFSGDSPLVPGRMGGRVFYRRMFGPDGSLGARAVVVSPLGLYDFRPFSRVLTRGPILFAPHRYLFPNAPLAHRISLAQKAIVLLGLPLFFSPQFLF